MTNVVWQRYIEKDAAVLPSASVEVRDSATNLLSTITTDRDALVPLSNPFTSDSTGLAKFYAPAGRYKITVSSGGGSILFNDVELVDSGAADTSAAAIAQNTSDIAQNTIDIAQNTSDIAQNTIDIAQNTIDIVNTFGSGQTWQDVSASRLPAVTYTNSTGSPIMVSVSWEASGLNTARYIIDGVSRGVTAIAASQSFASGGFSFIVLNGSTYSVETITVSAVNRTWHELRI